MTRSPRRTGALADRGSDQESEQNADNDRHERGHDDVDRGALRDQLAEEHGNDDDEEHGERSALRAEGVAAKPTASVEYMTNGGAFMLYAIAAAIAAPCTA